jgi:predicted dithiol-disulfide oxidoreductase (DUF899 family)
MQNHKVVSREEWLIARQQHLAKEKEFTRLRDQLSQERRDLPWVKIDKPYLFDGPNGKESLSEVFAGRSQLLVYHFMFGPEWSEGCKSCSFWADNFNSIIVHLNQRDATMVAISRAPLEKLLAFQKRMGWTFKWLSSYGSDFNSDFHVSFTTDDLAKGPTYYNYRVRETQAEGEAPGLSVFYRDASGAIFHTYSCYGRGLDMLNAAYHHLDVLPKGRDEAGLSFPQAWVKHHDKY